MVRVWGHAVVSHPLWPVHVDSGLLRFEDGVGSHNGDRWSLSAEPGRARAQCRGVAVMWSCSMISQTAKASQGTPSVGRFVKPVNRSLKLYLRMQKLGCWKINFNLADPNSEGKEVESDAVRERDEASALRTLVEAGLVDHGSSHAHL